VTCEATDLWTLAACLVGRFSNAWLVVLALAGLYVYTVFRVAKFAVTLLVLLEHVSDGLKSVHASIESFESGTTMAIDAVARTVGQLAEASSGHGGALSEVCAEVREVKDVLRRARQAARGRT